MPAPTKTSRPPFCSAAVMRSAAVAMRAFWRATAVRILRSSRIIRPIMSSVEAWSRARLAGLMASVGRSFHFEDMGRLTCGHCDGTGRDAG